MASYLIEFDILAGHNPGTGATLPPEVLDLTGWRSIGHPDGGRFINQTGVTIRSIYLQILEPTNSFAITHVSGGSLFNTIWIKQNAVGEIVETYFLDGNVPSSLFSAFWMRVPRNTNNEIQNCDSGQACPFAGRVLEQNPGFPTEPGWSVFHTTPPPADPILAEALAAAPSELRRVDAYDKSTDGRHVLLAAAGEVLLYDRDRKTISLFTPTKAGTAPKVDAIAFDAVTGGFSLLHGGETVKNLTPGASEMRSISE